METTYYQYVNEFFFLYNRKKMNRRVLSESQEYFLKKLELIYIGKREDIRKDYQEELLKITPKDRQIDHPRIAVFSKIESEGQLPEHLPIPQVSITTLLGGLSSRESMESISYSERESNSSRDTWSFPSVRNSE